MKTDFPIHELQTSMAAALVLWLVALASLGDAAEPQELPIAHDEYLYMIRFSTDGKTLVTAAGDNVARVWNWSTRELLHTLEHDAAVYAAVFSPDEDLLATGSGDGKVSLWKATTRKLVAQRQDHADAVYCLSFAPDGKKLATIGGDGKKGDTQCRIWSVPSLDAAKVLPGHDRTAYGVLFGPRASKTRALVTSGGDKLIHVYAHSSDERLTLKGHTSDVYRCCFSPDGEQLASTSQDGSVRIWNVATGNQLKTVFKAKDPTYDVAYSRDGSVLAAVGDDGFVRFWNTKTYELLLESKADKEGLYSVLFTPDQTSVLTGGVRGKVYECPVPRLDAK
jgi:WD40 repeat protein